MRALTQLLAEGRGKVLVFCWLGWVFDFYDLMLFAFVKASVAQDLGLDLATDIAWIDGFTLAATAVGGIAFGRLADRHSRRRALSLGIIVYSLGAFATAFADGFVSLLAARVVTGIGVGAEWGVGHTVVAEAYPPHLRNRAAAVLQAGSPIAMALAAAVGCFLAPEFGWRMCFVWSALPAVLVCFARFAIPDEPRSATGHAAPRAMPGFAALFRARLRKPSIALLTLLGLHMTGFWCTYAWLPTALIREAGASLAFVGWFQIGVNAVHVIADVAFGPLADRFGRRRVFVVSCLAFAFGLLVIAFGFESLTAELWVFGIAMAAVGLGAGTWSCFGVLFAETYPRELRATAASSFYNLSRGVQLLTQPAKGWLFVVTGTFAAALWVGAATALLSALAFGWVNPCAPRRSVEDCDT